MPLKFLNVELMWIKLQDMGLPEHLIDLLEELYRDQEATLITEFGVTESFIIEKACGKDVYYYVLSFMCMLRK